MPPPSGLNFTLVMEFPAQIHLDECDLWSFPSLDHGSDNEWGEIGLLKRREPHRSPPLPLHFLIVHIFRLHPLSNAGTLDVGVRVGEARARKKKN